MFCSSSHINLNAEKIQAGTKGRLINLAVEIPVCLVQLDLYQRARLQFLQMDISEMVAGKKSICTCTPKKENSPTHLTYLEVSSMALIFFGIS